MHDNEREAGWNFVYFWICKIWDLHGGNYEEYSLLEYKNPVRTSREAYYFSAIDSSRLVLCKVSGSRCGDYE
jgi:hypothetical protein